MGSANAHTGSILGPGEQGIPLRWPQNGYTSDILPCGHWPHFGADIQHLATRLNSK